VTTSSLRFSEGFIQTYQAWAFTREQRLKRARDRVGVRPSRANLRQPHPDLDRAFALRIRWAMSRDKRVHLRTKKRIAVEYGESELERSGFATDISIGGIFLQARQLLNRGTRLHLYLKDPALLCYTEGVVARIVRAPTSLENVEQHGMGIRFLPVDEIIMASLSPHLRKRETLERVIASQADLHGILADIAGGAVLVPAASPEPGINEMCEFVVNITLSGASEPLLGKGRVLQHLEIAGKKHLVIEPKDMRALQDTLLAKLT
jgi:PilZ domain